MSLSEWAMLNLSIVHPVRVNRKLPDTQAWPTHVSSRLNFWFLIFVKQMHVAMQNSAPVGQAHANANSTG